MRDAENKSEAIFRIWVKHVCSSKLVRQLCQEEVLFPNALLIMKFKICNITKIPGILAANAIECILCVNMEYMNEFRKLQRRRKLFNLPLTAILRSVLNYVVQLFILVWTLLVQNRISESYRLVCLHFSVFSQSFRHDLYPKYSSLPYHLLHTISSQDVSLYSCKIAFEIEKRRERWKVLYWDLFFTFRHYLNCRIRQSAVRKRDAPTTASSIKRCSNIMK